MPRRLNQSLRHSRPAIPHLHATDRMLRSIPRNHPCAPHSSPSSSPFHRYPLPNRPTPEESFHPRTNRLPASPQNLQRPARQAPHYRQRSVRRRNRPRKSPECPDANSTVAINECLAHENDLTDANLKGFTTAIRAILAQPVPRGPGEPEVYVGPSGPEGTPATNTAAFDIAQALWASYAEAECSAVDTLWRGGTIVNAIVGECGLRMSRLHLHELDTAYSLYLRPH